jgi:hypothetical protein
MEKNIVDLEIGMVVLYDDLLLPEGLKGHIDY